MNEKSKLAKFIDNSMVTLICFLIAFIITKKFTHSNIYSIFIASFISLIFIKILHHFQITHFNKIGLKKEEVKQIQYTNISFRKMTLYNQTIYLKKMFKSHKVKQFHGLLLLDNNVIISNNINQTELQVDNLFTLYSKIKANRLKPDEVAIICNQIAPLAIDNQNNFDIKFSFITPDIFYALTKKYKCEFKYAGKETKSENIFITLKTKLFLKTQAKYFLRCGLLLLIASLLVPYAKYYIISACITLLIGSFCLIFGHSETKKSISKLLKIT